MKKFFVSLLLIMAILSMTVAPAFAGNRTSYPTYLCEKCNQRGGYFFFCRDERAYSSSGTYTQCPYNAECEYEIEYARTRHGCTLCSRGDWPTETTHGHWRKHTICGERIFCTI